MSQILNHKRENCLDIIEKYPSELTWSKSWKCHIMEDYNNLSNPPAVIAKLQLWIHHYSWSNFALTRRLMVYSQHHVETICISNQRREKDWQQYTPSKIKPFVKHSNGCLLSHQCIFFAKIHALPLWPTYSCRPLLPYRMHILSSSGSLAPSLVGNLWLSSRIIGGKGWEMSLLFELFLIVWFCK